MKLLTENWQKFEAFLEKKDTGFKTYFPDIDRLLIGLPGLTTIQGEPKSCKSTFILNILLENALNGVPVLLYDFENGLNRTRLRILSFLSQLTIGAIRSCNLSQSERDKYNAAVETFKRIPFYYEGTLRQPEDIEEAVKELGASYKRPILVVVDSLQRLPLFGNDTRTSLNAWLTKFNEIKTKYSGWCSIILTSEKNRASYGKGSRSGGKETGEIEYLSEIILDLYPESDNKAINVECTYNRDGDIGLMTKLIKPTPFNFRLNCTEFLDAE